MAHPAPAVPRVPGRYSTAEYRKLVEDGVLGPDDRVELLEGVVVAVAPHSEEHVAGVLYADYALKRAVGDRAVVQVQLSLVQGERSVPEPDIAVVAGRLEDRLQGHPTSALLVVEVAGSSLQQDRLTKAPIYAANGVAEYWIVNLPACCVEVYRDPLPAKRRFGSPTIHSRGETIRLAALPEVCVRIDDLLPVRR